MAKIADRYLDVDPWIIRETGYHRAENLVSESIFSIANEYSGVRGFFDEGSDEPSLVGTYFNGVYVYHPEQLKTSYKGITNKVHFMVNSVNWLKTRIVADGEILNLSHCKFTDFIRELDLSSGEMMRSFIWHLHSGKDVRVCFKRLLSMESPYLAFQKLEFEALMDDVDLIIEYGLDFSIRHWNSFSFWEIDHNYHDGSFMEMIGSLPTKQRLYSAFVLDENVHSGKVRYSSSGKSAFCKTEYALVRNNPLEIVKRVVNIVEKNPQVLHEELIQSGRKALSTGMDYVAALKSNRNFYARIWNNIDIEITGDEKNQQGIRYCLFQLIQTYHGYNSSNNIGAKGLTGEAYSGHTFWDTETYCLPFYLFNNPEAAKSLLIYRYNTLEQAKARARELDCHGACFPIATLNGEESCDLWQHASLQMQPSTAVAYAVMHYYNNTGDIDFLFDYGVFLLVEISRYVYSRGNYNADGSRFGFYGVMGPDEFQMMVNHNAYTNFMGKNTLEDTLKVLKLLKKRNENKYNLIIGRLGIKSEEIADFSRAAKLMYLPYDARTHLYEQHQGYFDLPHINVDEIPQTEFPLYNHWSYDRIYRNDMIKQPDVLMMMFLKNQNFTKKEKLVNYEFYEPRCIHESSLSPSIHSVLAAELDKHEEAIEFFGFATRLDLDNYNRNTSEGLHLTSIAAAWVNIVYGFGGLRSDGETLVLRPKIPPMWENYSFRFVYHGVRIKVWMDQQQITIDLDHDLQVPIFIGHDIYRLAAGTHRFTKDYRRIMYEEDRTQGVSQG